MTDFHPILDRTGAPVKNLIKLKVTGLDLIFHTEKMEPQLPLLAYGEISHIGWDIPTHYAIDANKACWADNAHGFPMRPIKCEDFLRLVRSELGDRGADLFKILGVEPPEPSWMAKARAAGWGPLP